MRCNSFLPFENSIIRLFASEAYVEGAKFDFKLQRRRIYKRIRKFQNRFHNVTINQLSRILKFKHAQARITNSIRKRDCRERKINFAKYVHRKYRRKNCFRFVSRTFKLRKKLTPMIYSINQLWLLFVIINSIRSFTQEEIGRKGIFSHFKAVNDVFVAGIEPIYELINYRVALGQRIYRHLLRVRVLFIRFDRSYEQ